MKLLRRVLLSLLLMTGACLGQEPPPREVPLFSQAELDQMLAPIALYPDQLLAQILMAATYPLEVVQAARWSREHPGLQGQNAVQAVGDKGWDVSVKALVAFPNVLSQMDADLDWTERLGDAFLAQQKQVMETVQDLRRRAWEAGNLRSTPETIVTREREVIVLRPLQPEVIYVPYYDPFTVYGRWWWPYYRPVYWAPWPGYSTHVGYGSGAGLYWGSGISLGINFFYSDWDWDEHYVRVEPYHPNYYRAAPYPPRVWVHDYRHRRGVPYRHYTLERRYVPHDATPAYRHDYGGQGGDRDHAYGDNEAKRYGDDHPARRNDGVQPRRAEPPEGATMLRTQDRPETATPPPRIQVKDGAETRTISSGRGEPEPEPRARGEIGQRHEPLQRNEQHSPSRGNEQRDSWHQEQPPPATQREQPRFSAPPREQEATRPAITAPPQPRARDPHDTPGDGARRGEASRGSSQWGGGSRGDAVHESTGRSAPERGDVQRSESGRGAGRERSDSGRTRSGDSGSRPGWGSSTERGGERGAPY